MAVSSANAGTASSKNKTIARKGQYIPFMLKVFERLGNAAKRLFFAQKTGNSKWVRRFFFAREGDAQGPEPRPPPMRGGVGPDDVFEWYRGKTQRHHLALR